MKTGELTESKVEGIFLKRRTENRGQRQEESFYPQTGGKVLSSKTGGEDENMRIER